MADEPDKEPQTTDEAVKAVRRTIAQHGAVLDEMASVLETHDAQLMLLIKQGVFLTLTMAVALYAINRLAKEVGADGRTAQ